MSNDSLKYKTKKGLVWNSINQFANLGLSFVVGVVMARLLTPSDYGITALPSIFVAIAEIFIWGGFSSAMVRKVDLNEEDLSTAFYYSISIGIVLYTLFFFLAPLIASFYETPVLIPLIRITTLSFLWSPLTTPQNIILQRKLDFKTPARITITTKIIGAILGIGLAYAGYGVWSLVIMTVVSSFLSFVQTWAKVKWMPTHGWSKSSFRYLWGYGNKLMISTLIDRLYTNLTPLIIGKYFGVNELGLYNRANGYANLPSQQGTNVVQQVTFPVLSKMQEDDQMLAINYRRILKCTAFIIFPVMFLIAALARPLILLLIGEKWEECILLLQILCFSAMWYPIHAINLNLLQVKGRSDLFLKVEIIKKIFGLLILVVSVRFGLIVFVASCILTSLVSLFINTYYTGKMINVGLFGQMKDYLPILLLSTASFISVVSINSLIGDLLLELVVGGIIGTLAYIGFAFIFKFDELNDVKYMISKN